MPTMITFRAGRVALVALLAASCAGCSREQQDYRSAEAADTSEAYGRFLEQHADSELASQARARIEQLAVERDWVHAGSVATVEAYRRFLARHPTGRWSEEARIRIEAFALGSAPRTTPQTPEEAARAPSGVRALQLATAAPPPPPLREELAAPIRPARVEPGEAAQPQATPVSNLPAMAGFADYGVQLGAFGSPASADREWQRLQGRFGAQLGGLSPRIIAASTNSGQLYRLQVAAAGESQARAICDSLREQSQACVPVVPR
jgi:cell division septation protein DedD